MLLIKKKVELYYVDLDMEKIKYLKTNNKIKTQPYGMEIQP
jgi:hypothetical protein